MGSNRSGELPTVRQNEPTRSGEGLSLLVVQGPDTGAALAIDASVPSRVLVGTSPVCTFRLSDPEVSRRHASLRADGSLVTLSDLGSTNGTFVNGVRVREALLAGGEAIRIGASVLSIVAGPRSLLDLGEQTALGRVLGSSRVMRALYPVLEKLAATELPILVEGETGVGKALCAEEMHARSSRAGRALVRVSPQAIPQDELESRLFDAGGAVESAQGGALFIDEIAAVSKSTQLRLLRMIERPVEGDPRLYFATRRDLDRDVAEGRFSEPLLVRLAAGRVEVPPLRDRDDDAGLLATAFWQSLAAAEATESDTDLPTDFMPRFVSYGWPGNVRELERAVCVRFRQGALGRWRASGDTRPTDPIEALLDRELPLTEARNALLDEFERRYVDHMIARHGSTRDAARASGVALRYFQLLRARTER